MYFRFELFTYMQAARVPATTPVRFAPFGDADVQMRRLDVQMRPASSACSASLMRTATFTFISVDMAAARAWC